MPEDLQSLHRGVALARRSVVQARLEQLVLGLQTSVLIPEPGHLARVAANSSGLLEPEKSLLTSRLSTQHHGSHDQGNGSLADLHVGTLHREGQRQTALPRGLLW